MATCSEECKKARGKHGGLRLSDGASTGTGFVPLDWSQRHNGDSGAEAVAFDLLGEPDSDASGWSVAFTVYDQGDGVRTYDTLKVHAEGMLARERSEATERGSEAVSDVFGLIAPMDVGRTCPGILDRHVIGQSDVPADWQEAF